jgi:GNAT superfamily N-acetyltransferase
MTLRLSAEHETASPEDVRFVGDQLTAFNRAHAPDPGWSHVRLFLRDETGAIRGGLLGDVYFGWLYVAILWIDEAHRGQGHGQELLRQAEDEAAARGCHAVWLDTFAFQAPDFYPGLGYQQFGRLDDYPEGISRHFFRKKLTAAE